MRSLALILVLSFGYIAIYAQDSPNDSLATERKKNAINRIWIKFKNKSKTDGILYQVTDSSIWVTSIQSKSKIKNNWTDVPAGKEYFISDIKKVSLRKYKSVGRSTGIGLLIGATTGFLVSYAIGENDDFVDEGFSAALGGTLGALVGVLTSTKFSYIINGNLDNFQKIKRNLASKAIVNY